MKRVNDKMLIIDGEKFKALLESKTGKTIKELSLENGYSDSFLRMVVKTGKASPSAVTLAKLYGIEPTDYEKPERVTTLRALEYEREQKQLTIDDLNTISRDELKELLKEVIQEELVKCFNSLACTYDNVKAQTIFFIDKEA